MSKRRHRLKKSNKTGRQLNRHGGDGVLVVVNEARKIVTINGEMAGAGQLERFYLALGFKVYGAYDGESENGRK